MLKVFDSPMSERHCPYCLPQDITTAFDRFPKTLFICVANHFQTSDTIPSRAERKELS